MSAEVPVHDVAILGSGFAGALLARVLNRAGRRVLLLERGRHPRFALGESTTPLANLCLERLALRYRLPDLHHLAAHGRWLEHLPHLRRGLKRGFTFYHHPPNAPFRNSPENEARLMVAASPNDRVADSHWLRRDVDLHLVDRARVEGVCYVDRTRVHSLELDRNGDTVRGVTVRAEGPAGPVAYRARVVVDATGPAGVSASSFGLRSRIENVALRSALLFGHFEGVEPLSSAAPEAHFGNAPFPEEAAAVHHLLDIGWLYVLRFD
ncbi:MAG: FAD-binding protein, partial [Holophagales bacterium]|nr:FAD-binding protein [Holophagales bacterium]